MGCCLFATALAGAPRLALLLWYLVQPLRFQATFQNMWWALVGGVFLPWATIMYLLVSPGGLNLFDWILLALALAADLSSYVGGGRAQQQRYA